MSNNHPTNHSREYQKNTILQVLPALVSGGVERGTVDIAISLKKNGYNSIVISNGGPMVQSLEEAQIPHVQINVATKNPFTLWRNSHLISEVIRQYNVDIIHVRSRAPAWSCYLAAQRCNIKFLTTFHGIYNISGFLKKYYNSIMTKGERIIAVSNFVKQHIIQNYNIDEEKISVIYRGVDIKYFDENNILPEHKIKFREKYHIPKNVPVILLPSRMTKWKGHLVLIEALSKIKHLDFYCLMVGDLSKHPNFTKQVQESIMQHKLQSKIQIFGNELDMLKLYGISDIVLSTSIEPEAFGRTVVEGQAMEKIVIASNIGGAAETILSNINGYHVIPGDAGDLADKISYALQILGTTDAKQISRIARKNAIENFSLDLMLKHTIAIYDSLLKLH